MKANHDIVLVDKERELKNTSFVKTILMVLIVFYHSIIFLNGKWFTVINIAPGNRCVRYIIDWLNSFHIYAFTLVSGYLFFYVKYERKGYNSFIPFVVNKVKRLVIPYLFVTVVWAVPIYIFFFKPSLSTVIRRFVLGENPNQLWFLLMLFGVFVIAWPLSDLSVKKYSFWIPIIIFIIGKVAAHYFPNFFQIWTAFRYFLFFYIGFKIRQNWDKFINRISCWLYVLIDIFLFVMCLLGESKQGCIWSVLGVGLDVSLNIVGALMAWRVLQSLSNVFDWTESKIILFLNERSMIVYLFHQQIIYFVIFYLNGVINQYCIVISNFIVSITISLVIATILLKSNVTRFLTGEKSIKK